MKTVFFAIDTNNSHPLSSVEYDNEADAYLSAISDGKADFKRDADGYMRPEIDGKQVFQGGSFNENDAFAKSEILRELHRIPSSSLDNFAALKVEFDNKGRILKINDENEPDLINYWTGRVSLYIPNVLKTTSLSPQKSDTEIRETQREHIATCYAAALAKDREGVSTEPTEFHRSFADAIIDKDAYRLNHLANGLNNIGKQIFSEATGIKLPAGQAATWNVLREWANISVEKDEKNQAWQNVVFQRRLIEPRVGLDAIIWATEKVEAGFNDLIKAGRETWLANSEKKGYNLSAKGSHLTVMSPFIKSFIAYEKANQRYKDSLKEKEATVSEGLYFGTILNVGNGVVTQKTGRLDNEITKHSLANLAGNITKGDVVEIAYQQHNRGTVKSLSQVKGLER